MPAAKTSRVGVSQFMDRGLALKLNKTQRKAIGDGPKAVKLANIHHVLKDDRKLSGLVGKLKLAKTPKAFAEAMINAKYQSLGGVQGFLKKATTPVRPCPDGEGFFRHYQGGSIYFHPDTGAHEVRGAIRGLWASLGWEREFLGYPVTDELIGRDKEKRGRYSRFQGGVVYWHPATGAHEVHGAILGKYRELGEEASFLGYPSTNETTCPDRRGRFNHFQGGSIYWTPQTWAHEVHGLIRHYWATHGWERNDELGYPLSDESIPDRDAGGIRSPARVAPFRGNLPDDAVVMHPVDPIGVGVALPPMTRAPLTPRKKTTGAKAKKAAVKLSPKNMALRAEAVRLNAIRNIAVLQPGELQSVEESKNRFSDFENGVLFWHRGANQAILLKPWKRTQSGKSMTLSRTQVLSKVRPRINQMVGSLPSGLKFMSAQAEPEAGPYRFDGVRPLNREHRIRLNFRVKIHSGGSWVNSQITVILRLLVEHDPFTDQMTATFSGFDWKRFRSGLQHVDNPDFAMHKIIDPHLWKPFELLKIPKKDGNRTITVLSIKTLEDGQVVVYIEPPKRAGVVGPAVKIPGTMKAPSNILLRNPQIVKRKPLKPRIPTRPR
jgi:hypothetical protein